MSVITLLTDFGTSDSYVAEVKGVLLRGAPGAVLVDISHAVPPGNISTAAYLLGRTWKHFPQGTVHLVVVDPGVGSTRRAVAVGREGHLFVAPDNGVLTPVIGPGSEVWTLAEPEGASPTFHGRDLFAPPRRASRWAPHWPTSAPSSSSLRSFSHRRSRSMKGRRSTATSYTSTGTAIL